MTPVVKATWPKLFGLGKEVIGKMVEANKDKEKVEQEQEELFKQADVDGDGMLNEEEFVAFRKSQTALYK